MLPFFYAMWTIENLIDWAFFHFLEVVAKRGGDLAEKNLLSLRKIMKKQHFFRFTKLLKPDKNNISIWRDGRVVECAGLLNR